MEPADHRYLGSIKYYTDISQSSKAEKKEEKARGIAGAGVPAVLEYAGFFNGTRRMPNR